ncbi:MAG: hypothetical protein IJ524_08675 [Bacteroidales bacterium]|nr:hypothetical protein [Bacteroidales bacterium]
MKEKPKPYNTEEQALPTAAEHAAVYGYSPSSDDGILSTLQNVSRRMTVDEYFDEVKKALHRKYEDVQG